MQWLGIAPFEATLVTDTVLHTPGDTLVPTYFRRNAPLLTQSIIKAQVS